ncbi:MAG: hypothetical protein CMJ19_06945 [Phycisphaeraceae bacterium]|nr:hypothetical protein [Phycisphaeraceae bacterium]
MKFLSSAHLREYITVTLVAVLVWLYAEGENIKTYEMDIPIQFVAATGQDLLIKPTRLEDNPRVTFQCSSAQYVQLDQLFDGKAIPIPLSEDPNAPDGNQQLLLKQVFTSLPIFANLSVNITEVKPAQVVVNVKKLQAVELKIAQSTEGDSLIQDVVIEPATATLHLPKDLLNNLTESDTITARLNKQVLDRLTLNQSHTIDGVQLLAPAGVRSEDVRIDPPSAKVTFTLTRQTKNATISSIAVRLVMPVASMSQYDVSLVNDQDKLIRSVKLTGPNDLIDDIASRKIKIWADLKLEADDLAKGVGKESIAIVPLIQKPESVKLVEAPGAINLKITARQ